MKTFLKLILYILIIVVACNVWAHHVVQQKIDQCLYSASTIRSDNIERDVALLTMFCKLMDY